MRQSLIPQNILTQYDGLKNILNIEPFGNGHINDTYLVRTKTGKFILQRVNPNVFKTDILVSNAEKLIPALEKYQSNHQQKLSPQFIKNRHKKTHSLDEQGAAWRVIEFIEGCQSYSITTNTANAYHGAQSLGQFQLFLNTLDPKEFDETIPHFHHPAGRLKAFKETLSQADEPLQIQARPEIDFILDHQSIAGEIERLTLQNKIPRRITHNDPKLENILFTPNRQSLVIDLDTVMPSTILFDYGDMVRTFTPSAAEDEPRTEKVSLRIDHFEAMTKGYLEQIGTFLTTGEKENLLLGAKSIVYEQSLRFLTDFLNGNTYYKVDYPKHNLVRTRTQIKLLNDIFEKEKPLNQIIRANTRQSR